MELLGLTKHIFSILLISPYFKIMENIATRWKYHITLVFEKFHHSLAAVTPGVVQMIKPILLQN